MHSELGEINYTTVKGSQYVEILLPRAGKTSSK